MPLKNCGLVYELTPYGHQLEPIMLALERWGFAQMGDPSPGDVVTADSLTMALRTSFRSDASAAFPATDFELHVGEVVVRARVDPRTLVVTQIAPPAPPVGGGLPVGEPDLVFAAGPGIRWLIGGELTVGEALAQDVVDVMQGDPALLERFATMFHIDTAGAADVAA